MPDTFNISPTKTATPAKKWIWIIVVVAAAAVALIIGLSVGLTRNKGGDQVTTEATPPPTTLFTTSAPTLAEFQRVTCFPEGTRDGPITAERCQERGCMYQPSTTEGVPPCFISADSQHGLRSDKYISETPLGWKLNLTTRGRSIFGVPISNVEFEIEMRGDNVIHFKFEDANNKNRYKVPEEILSLQLPQGKSSNPSYEVNITNHDPFSFQILRRSTGTVVWDTNHASLAFADQFLQISTLLPSQNIYGFGENVHSSFRHDLNYRTWPAWTRDEASATPSLYKNLYSVHPFYECVEEDGNTHGVLLLNSNAMEYELTPAPMLTYRTIGGILDFFVFMGPTPENVIQQYTTAIGRPIMPPYWGLGFQLCRYNYTGTDDIRETVNRTNIFKIPQDIQYADIDYMYKQRDFTIDMENFGDLPDYFQALQKEGLHTIIILDPALEINDTYEPYVKGRDEDMFIKWPSREAMPPGDYEEYNRTDMMGYVWPEWKVVFPDFFLSQTEKVWTELVLKFNRQMPFDGIWIDMNEPANFGTNEEQPWNWADGRPAWSLKCAQSSLDDPPFPTKAAYGYDGENYRGRLSDKTLCMVAKQGQDGKYDHYDVHNLYGLSQTIATSKSIRTLFGEEKRSIIVTRSSYPGTGRYAGRWLGDNRSDWLDMRASIIGMLEFNLFGIPYIGADICGFFDDSTPELCKRWQQVGAFYPYSRNHNHAAAKRQDPASFGDEVAIPAREALMTRYTLLPYLYSLFHLANIRGGTVVRPLHHEFPQDKVALSIDRQFMWGPAILFSPVLEEGATTLDYYLPEGQWYDYYLNSPPVIGPQNRSVAISRDEPIHIHLREGYIIPTQEPAINTNLSRQNPFGLLVTLPRNVVRELPLKSLAEGELFWDDGELVESYEKNIYYKAHLMAQSVAGDIYSGNLNMTIVHNHPAAGMEGLVLNTVDIMGLQPPPPLYNYYINLDNNTHNNYTYDENVQVLSIKGLHLSMTEPFHLEWGLEPPEFQRVSCFPEGTRDGPITAERCQERGCMFQASDTEGVPPCFISYPSQHGLRTDGTIIETPLGWKINLVPKGNSIFGAQIANIYFDIEMRGDNVIHFKFDDADNERRYKVPESILSLQLPQNKGRNPRYDVKITSHDPFAFQILRRSTGTVIWDSISASLAFADQFLQISTLLPSHNIYGFGENVHLSFRHNLNYRTWPAWTRDEASATPSLGKNLYSVHPFYECVEEDGNTHGVLLLNSNAMEFELTPAPMLTYRTIGGILDFYVFMGPTPENVIQQYTTAIGRPIMPPYWSLGFQLCRYNYSGTDDIHETVNRTKYYGIPQDIQYADIDYMYKQRDFTIDMEKFGDLPDYFQALQKEGLHTIIILDPALEVNDTYEPYVKGRDEDMFIKWPSQETMPPGDYEEYNRTDMMGYVWPEWKAVFPDFFLNQTERVWTDLVVDFHSKLPFNGIWIDMNEPANFGTNEEKPWNWPDGRPAWSLKCAQSSLDDPPYPTKAAYGYDGENYRGRLSDKTLCMVAKQGQGGKYNHYDVHNLYGLSQTIATSKSIRTLFGEEKRSIIVTRSSYPGTGRYAGRWLGDNRSDWLDMRASIIGMLEFNLFGIPYIGADICGFFDDTTPELCKRWQQVGAFYPYSRNHNHAAAKRQDPASFGDEVAIPAREALMTRYTLLPYLYSLFHLANIRGGTVVRPLHHEFPQDKVALSIDRQFMWGPAILFSPVLEEGATTLDYYLPEGRWYDYYLNSPPVIGPQNRSVAISGDEPIHIHMREGYIIPTQEPAINTNLSRQNPFGLLVTLPRNVVRELPLKSLAEGELFWDDGELVESYEKSIYYKAHLMAQSVAGDIYSGNLNMTIEHNHPAAGMEGLVLNTVDIMGLQPPPPLYNYYINLDNNTHDNYTYDENVQVLSIKGLHLSMTEPFHLEWGLEPPVSLEPPEFQRVSCFPEGTRDGPITAERCQERGCMFQASDTEGVPPCFISYPSQHGLRTDETIIETPLGWKINLVPKGNSIFGEQIANVYFDVEMRGDNMIHFKFDDADNERRYKVPESILSLQLPQNKGRNPRYDVKITSHDPFAFQILRRSTGTVIWDSISASLAFADQFLQISTLLPSHNIYGFGENVHLSFRHDLSYRTWPAWTRDEASATPSIGKNLYSVHPFYECVEEDGNTHGVLLLNSNAMEFELTPAPMLTYRTIGGILDFYVFMGPTPENVIQQYTTAIGRPIMPPYWSLGFQLCRYNYSGTDDIRETVNRTKYYGIPQDIQYADIDYMYKQRDFTIDMEKFGDLPDYFQALQKEGLHTIIILDPALEINDTYEPYVKGRDEDIFIKWPSRETMPPSDYEEYNRTDMMGYVWPEWKAVFPDFFLNQTERVWTELVVDFHSKLPFNGIWIDMNEPANFGTNEEKPWNWPDGRPAWSLKCAQSSLDDPPYPTKAAYHFDGENYRGRLSDKTLCMVAKQGQDGEYDHYDVHNLYGLSQTIATSKSIRTLFGDEKRSIIVTRSSYPGTGHYAGRWLGDNRSNWLDLRASIIGMLEFNLFGIPYIGADICGFFDDTTPELCKRWQQVGAFYPYSRNHNHEAAKNQDPASFGDEVAIPTREALMTRYTLLPYLYSLFHLASIRGGTVVRPLHHEFPQDKIALSIDRQFMWGPAILFSPVLEEGATTLEYYLPNGQWYDYYMNSTPVKGPQNRSVSITADEPIHIHLREGYIIPTQEPAINTNLSRQNPFGLIVALPRSVENELPLKSQAEGELFWDDGELVDSYAKRIYYKANFIAQSKRVDGGHHIGSLQMTIVHNHPAAGMEGLVLNTIHITGVQPPPSPYNYYIYFGHTTYNGYIYDPNTQVLRISGLNLSMTESFNLEWRTGRKATPEQVGRIDCCPQGCNQQHCEKRHINCVWEEERETPGVPWCSLKKDSYGYRVLGSSGGVYSLQHMRLSSILGGDRRTAAALVQQYDSLIRIKLYDDRNENYEVPINLNFPDEASDAFNITINDEPFGVLVSRPDGTVIWDSSLGGLTIAERFLQLAVRVNCVHVYGFGENEHPAFSHDMNYRSWGMFSRDQPPGPNINLYSVHPFYVCLEPDGRANAVLLLNSNAQEIVTLPTPGILYRTTGGVLDFYILTGDNPEDVLSKYHSLIGRPHLPPYWALGFHLSRYGYDKIENIQQAVNRTMAAEIPMDVQHLDIDVLHERLDFTYDAINFPNLPGYLEKLKSQGIHNVVILDPFLITNVSNYEPYKRGLQDDIFIKWPNGSSPDFEFYKNDNLLGWAWPTGPVVFPDFFHPNASEYWANLVVDYYNNEFHFDGIWLDMNDPANFGTNEEHAWNWPEEVKPYWTLNCSNDITPRYKPKAVAGEVLSEKTICMISEQNQGIYKHYDVHNLYAWSQTMPTLMGLERARGKRSMLVSRSTFPSSGKMAGKWLGDNASIWPHLHKSIIGILEFNLFGIPYIGADVCGYFNDCPAQLCQRWMQLGAFYTFVRNHNGRDYQEQDPAYFGPAVAASSKAVLEVRYTLLPYLYTLFYQAHVNGGTVIRPLVNEFPTDHHTPKIDRQFLWGPALLLSPVLEENTYEVLAYFPEGRWFSYHTGEEVTSVKSFTRIPAPSDIIPLHIRGGYIIPTQQPGKNTLESRHNAMSLIVAPNLLSFAKGSLFWDDGDSIGTVTNHQYLLAEFTYNMMGLFGELKTNIINDYTSVVSGLILDQIRLFGQHICPTAVSKATQTLSGVDIQCDTHTKEVILSNLQLDLTERPFPIISLHFI